MLSFIAFALQAAFAKTVPTVYDGNPNIVVPSTTALHWYDKNKPHTLYLIWNGPDPRHQNGAPPEVNIFGPLVAAGPPGFAPFEVRNAYDITLKGSNAIAVVDYGHLATSLTDFNTFSSEFGLPQETSSNPLAASNKVFQVVYEHPNITPPVGTGWALEEALDFEWAHAMAPNAKIYVIESDDGDLDSCNQIAAAISGVKEVSNSWIDYLESNGSAELQEDKFFQATGVTFYSGAGDIGGWQGYPSTSPFVVSVGGTSLQMNELGTAVVSETAWNGSGGGPSLYEPVPAYQASIPSIARQVHSFRGTPDLAAIADPSTGVAVYEQGWYVVGGTSVATPVTAGIVNTTNTFLASGIAEHNLIYSLFGTTSFRDIVQGTAGNFTAGPGWDFITGCGAPLNISRPIITAAHVPDAASTLTGTFQSGNVGSLAAVDGNDYSVKGVVFSGLGSTADVRAHFTFINANPSLAASGTITVTANANTANVINEIFVYNTITKNYDLLATPVLTSTNSAFTVTLTAQQAPQYVDSSGNVVVLSRALLPQRNIVGANAGYLYNVDKIQVTYGFYQNSLP